jgi:signal transduction histidine kinase
MTPSTLTSVLCLGNDPTFVAVVAEAARRLGTDTVMVRSVTSLHEAARAGESNDGAFLLALCHPTGDLVQQAIATVDADALPRWSVVVFGSADVRQADVPTVPPEDWNAAVAFHVFRAAMALHTLRRERARLRGDLATMGSRIAHDLRTPLGGIMTTAEMLREILEEEHPASVPHLAPILESADSMAKLIERISFFAKATVSTEPPQRCDMGAAFWNAFQCIERRLLNSGATLQQPSRWPAVFGHPAWLETVWRSLLVNAVQHSEPGTRIEAGWSEDGDLLRFWLQNSRSAQTAKKPEFFPFHRLHEPGPTRGLGLPIVQRLIQREGGVCGVETTTAGVRLFFTLPANPVSAPASPTPAAS